MRLGPPELRLVWQVAHFLVQIGWADAATHRRGNDRFYADYLAGTLDMHGYVEFATAPWRGRKRAN